MTRTSCQIDRSTATTTAVAQRDAIAVLRGGGRFRLARAWILALVFISWFLLRLPTRWELDSIQVYLGSGEIIYWLQGRSPAGLGWVRPFPLFQYLSGVPAFWADTHGIPLNVYWLWATLSSISLAGIALVLWRVARRTSGSAAAWLVLVVLLSGPLIFYAPSTFNELPAAFVILCFTAAVTRSGGVLVCVLLFWLGGITKEIAPPLLGVVWLAGLWLRRSNLSRAQMLRHLIGLGAAMVLAVATNAAFNLLRYGVAWNVEYLKPYLLIHSISRRAQNSLALWFSPSGGIVPFWMSLALVLVGISIIAIRRRDSAFPALAVLVLLGLLTVGLSGWYEPLGWWSWGPRLALPWLPAALLILLRGYSNAFAELTRQLTRTRIAFVLMAIAACLCALPNVYASPKPQVITHFFDPDITEPQWVPPVQHDAYFVRNVFLAWRKMPPLLLRPFFEPAGWSIRLSTAGYLASLVILLKQAQRRGQIEDRTQR